MGKKEWVSKRCSGDNGMVEISELTPFALIAYLVGTGMYVAIKVLQWRSEDRKIKRMLYPKDVQEFM